MTDQLSQIKIPERTDDEAPATADQLRLIRQLTTGRSLQGYRFDYRKLGQNQAQAILKQLQAMPQQSTPAQPRKQGPGCLASLAKSATALIVWLIVLAGVAGGAYLIYNHIQNNPKPTASSPENTPNNTPDTPSSPDRPQNQTSTPSTIFEGLGSSDTPNQPANPTTPKPTTDPPAPAPEPTTPPTPTIDRDLLNQLAELENLLVNLSQYTRNDFPANIREQSSQAMHNKLADLPKALAALDQADPTISLRIKAIIDAFAAPSLDAPALREDIKSIRQAIDRLK